MNNSLAICLKSKKNFTKNFIYEAGMVVNGGISGNNLDVAGNNGELVSINCADKDFMIISNPNNDIIQLLNQKYQKFEYGKIIEFGNIQWMFLKDKE